MKTQRIVNTVEELKAHLTDIEPLKREVEEVQFQYAGVDDRNGWTTYHVKQRFKNETAFYLVGMSNGVFKI